MGARSSCRAAENRTVLPETNGLPCRSFFVPADGEPAKRYAGTSEKCKRLPQLPTASLGGEAPSVVPPAAAPELEGTSVSVRLFRGISVPVFPAGVSVTTRIQGARPQLEVEHVFF